MSATITETAEAFSRHQFEDTYPFILDEAEWTLVGAKHVHGKADIVRACQESASYLVNAKTSTERARTRTSLRSINSVSGKAHSLGADGTSTGFSDASRYEAASPS
jgi:hypothetical protein